MGETLGENTCIHQNAKRLLAGENIQQWK